VIDQAKENATVEKETETRKGREDQAKKQSEHNNQIEKKKKN
jgi:hypothetical protein